MDHAGCVSILCLVLFGVTFASKYHPPCDSNIYCHGPLLHTIQMAELFKDSKTFVDMKLKFPPDQIQKNFDDLMAKHKQKPSKADLETFVNSNFDKEGSEFEPWNPDDWHENPKFLKNISDPGLRTWATKIHSYWKELGRKIKDEVRDRPELYSMIYTSHPVIVPGGRFREFFYWDSYWIMKGLLLSEMNNTVKGMLENFIEMVNQLGYVPNGGRVYFRRSQPPLLIPMMKLYLDATQNIDFLKSNMPALEKEFEFWMKNRLYTVQTNGKSYQVFRYNVEYTGPRPESYREDYKLAEGLSEAEQDELYFNLKSGAESGWDFSSRWYMPPAGVKGNLSHTKIRDIIPVELNAFMQLNAKLMSEFYMQIGDPSKSPKYENLANQLKTTINELLWDEGEGCWFDFDIINLKLRKEFYPSNLSPLWAGAEKSPDDVLRVMEYMNKVGALVYPGGVPTSLAHPGEQWDFPNGWAPLQHLIVEALDRSGNSKAQSLAMELAEKWVSTNYKAFKQVGKMFEKYDVTVVGIPGGGGEYEVVVGFGWTNGVALDFMNRYGDKLRESTDGKTSSAGKVSNYLTHSIAFGGISILLASLLGLTQVTRKLRDGGCDSLTTSCLLGYSRVPSEESDTHAEESQQQQSDIHTDNYDATLSSEIVRGSS